MFAYDEIMNECKRHTEMVDYNKPEQKQIPSYMTLVNKEAFICLSAYKLSFNNDLSYITLIYDISPTKFREDIQKRFFELKGMFNAKAIS